MNNKYGFTLSEVLVTMAALGLIAVVLIPTADKLKPNHELLMFKKAYYTASRVVQDLINDPYSYPGTNDPDTSGFSNTSHVVTYHNEPYGGEGDEGGLRRKTGRVQVLRHGCGDRFGSRDEPEGAGLRNEYYGGRDIAPVLGRGLPGDDREESGNIQRKPAGTGGDYGSGEGECLRARRYCGCGVPRG